jgi:hypothetical protein
MGMRGYMSFRDPWNIILENFMKFLFKIIHLVISYSYIDVNKVYFSQFEKREKNLLVKNIYGVLFKSFV